MPGADHQATGSERNGHITGTTPTTARPARPQDRKVQTEGRCQGHLDEGSGTGLRRRGRRTPCDAPSHRAAEQTTDAVHRLADAVTDPIERTGGAVSLRTASTQSTEVATRLATAKSTACGWCREPAGVGGRQRDPESVRRQ